MAKVRVKEEEKNEEATFNPEQETVEVVADEAKNDDVVTDENSGVTFTAKDSKKFKVRLRADHSCHIGDETFHFKKGETYNVSGDVKRILASADLLSNL